MARGKPTDTHCANGHEFTPENTYVYPPGTQLAGKRVCKVCRMNAQRKHKGLLPLERDSVGNWNRNKTHCPLGHLYDVVKADGARGCKTCHKNNQRKLMYGISNDEYCDLMESQGGVCAICGLSEWESKLHVDHDHDTNKVRGLLCNNCNNGLGRFKDSVESLRNAIVYLETNKEN